MQVIRDRNVNGVLPTALMHFRYGVVREVTSRGMSTIEVIGPVATVYERPRERVLFDPLRHANPFFHFFEALWILAGRNDVAFLSEFNKRMRQYSDDGRTFHAPYGARLRRAYAFDQIETAINQLRKTPDTRQAVLTIWVPTRDMDAASKDIPCNDMVFLKVRDGRLDMTVCCRSNDAIWGAYGANVVQFSMLQEYLAARILGSGEHVGTYTQVSDSLHIYTDNLFWLAYCEQDAGRRHTFDQYSDDYLPVVPYLLFDEPAFEDDLRVFFSQYDMGLLVTAKYSTMAFNSVVLPMWNAHALYREGEFSAALAVMGECAASDWKYACIGWLSRQQLKREAL